MLVSTLRMFEAFDGSCVAALRLISLELWKNQPHEGFKAMKARLLGIIEGAVRGNVLVGNMRQRWKFEKPCFGANENQQSLEPGF